MVYSQVIRGCWRCAVGEFVLMKGSNCYWECSHCHHIGYLKVSDK